MGIRDFFLFRRRSVNPSVVPSKDEVSDNQVDRRFDRTGDPGEGMIAMGNTSAPSVAMQPQGQGIEHQASSLLSPSRIDRPRDHLALVHRSFRPVAIGNIDAFWRPIEKPGGGGGGTDPESRPHGPHRRRQGLGGPGRQRRPRAHRRPGRVGCLRSWT